MTLEDLVTDALAPTVAEEKETGGSAGVCQTLHREGSSGSLLHEGEALLSQMQEAEGEEFHFLSCQLAALFLAFARSEYANPYSLADQARSPKLLGAEIFARAADQMHLGGDRGEILAFARQALDNHYLQHFFADPAEHIVFIEEIWGDETVEKLARLGGVQKGTARNWMKGSSPASAAHSLRRTVDVLYHLRSSLGIEGEAAREWMETPLPEGPTPFDVICNREQSSWNRRSGEVKLDPLTRKLESEGIRAFSWPATSR